MPKTVLIILAAVIALIAIVVYSGVRYLRADDEDDFDDDVPAENGRSRSRGSHLPHEQPRNRRHHDDLPDERLRERQDAVRVAAGHGSDRGPDRAATRHGGDDRGWREDSDVSGRRPSQPPREQRPGRSGRLHDDDISEPIAASARPGRTSASRSGQHDVPDYDARTTRMPATGRDHDRDEDGRGSRDRLGRAEDRDPRDRRDSREVRTRRDSRAAAGARDTLSAADSVRDTLSAADKGGADRDERDRRSTARPGTRPDSRAAAEDRAELLPPVKPRQGRSKKDADGDWPSNEWDELSDVDYWAELASDRPLTTSKPHTPAKPVERSRPVRGDTRLDATPGPARGERPEVAAGRDSRSQQPGRPARQPDQIRQPDPIRHPEPIVPPVTRKPDLGERSERSEEFIGTGSRRASMGRTERLAAVPQPPAPARGSRHATPADDDPLTSPSFPRIQADDSRSYRRSRTPGPDELPPASRTTDTGSHRARELAPSREPAYPAVPRAEPVRGRDGLTQPHGYQRPAEDTTSGYGVASPGYERAAADYAGSASEPYRAPSTSSVSGSYQVPAAASADRYPSSTGAYTGSASAAAGYAVPAASGGYPVPNGSAHASQPAGYPVADSGGYSSPAANGSGGYQGSGGLPPASYPPAAASQGGYGGETVARGTYPDPAGYQSSLPSAGGYQADQGAGGQPAPASGSYAFPPEPASSYPGPADQLSYPGYAGPGGASGSHLRAEPGYLAGGYPASQEPSFGGSLPGGQPEVGYPIYAAPVPVSQSTPYQVPGPPLPGSAQPSGYPEPQYRPDLYDPPAYQVPVPETGGYAGADPYAMDPYGYSGYGSGGH